MSVPILDVPYDTEGVFVSRENRFLGIVEIGSREEKVHIRDPGRLEEILYPSNSVLLSHEESPKRTTNWDLLAGNVSNHWIFVNSGYHRTIAELILKNKAISPFGKVGEYSAEQQLGNSRIDFLLKKNGERIWVEVKGCTLAEDGIALFPDAPTTRGTRHVEELTHAVAAGDSAALMILVFRPDSRCFSPYEPRDPAFAEAFCKAVDTGVAVHPLVFSYRQGILYFEKKIPLCDKK